MHLEVYLIVIKKQMKTLERMENIIPSELVEQRVHKVGKEAYIVFAKHYAEALKLAEEL
jgi:hypothetical protein